MEIWQIILIILAIVAVIFVILYFVGSKLQASQAEKQKAMQNATMKLNLLVIDKAKLKISQSGLMKQVKDSIPAYIKWRKFPIVKARIVKTNVAGGAQVISFICDPKIFKIIPVKTEVQCMVSGIYITKLISAKGVDLKKLNASK